jgi:hypothetical protein
MTPPSVAFTRLRRTNVLLGALHAIQGAAVLLLANDFAVPVTGAFLEGPPGSGAGDPRTLFTVPFAVGVAGFLLLSAAAHWVIASPWYHPRYAAGLAAGHNHARWVEYSLSASLMIVLIAMLTGISDIAALIALFAANAAMIFFGSLQEKYERPGGGRLPFWLGSVVGLAPWVAIGVYLVSPGSAAQPPGFVYGIYFSLFVCFNAFALNQWLQYRGRGRWSDYLFGERVYMGLSG